MIKHDELPTPLMEIITVKSLHLLNPALALLAALLKALIAQAASPAIGPSHRLDALEILPSGDETHD